MAGDPFIREHKDEIEAMAYKIYLERKEYCQADDPELNWTRAVCTIKAKYKQKEAANA